MAGFFDRVWSGNATRKALKSIDKSGADHPFAGATAIGDFNGDGHQDVLIPYSENEDHVYKTGPVKGRLVLLAGDGKGGFDDATSTLPGKGKFDLGARKVAVGDYNGDGADDVAYALNYENGRDTADPTTNASQQFVLLSKNGQLKKKSLDFITWGHALAAGDLDGDGRDDIVIGGFVSGPGGTNTAIYHQSPGGRLEKTWLDGRSGLAEAIGDFDGDGVGELVDYYSLWEAGRPVESGLRLTSLSPAGAVVEEVLSPHKGGRSVDGMTWNGATIHTVIKDNQGNDIIDQGLHDFKVGDLDKDGKDDIVAIRFATEMEYVDGVLQNGRSLDQLELYTANKNNKMVKMKGSIAGYESATYGVFDIRLIDWNDDGHLDIFVYQGEIDWPANQAEGTARLAQVLLNDGNANFTRIPKSYLPEIRSTYWVNADPIDANNDGVMDLLVRPDNFDFSASWSSLGRTTEELWLGTKRFDTGPDYSNTTGKAPGFNEDFYLNTYKAVKKAVKKGKFDSGLDHYLNAGKKNGLDTFAAGTKVHGGDRKDEIVLREGDETALGNKGADKLIGKGGDDVLDGGGGHDVLRGDVGADKLIGGKGKDKFVFRKVKESKPDPEKRDVILDFSRKQGDKIVVKKIDARAGEGKKNDAFSFIKKKAFAGESGELRYEKEGNTLYVYGDVDGDARADISIEVHGVKGLLDKDFIL